MKVKSRFRNIAVMGAILIISVPLSFVITIMLLPFWNWIESTFEIESVGHSGPAEWCYLACYIFLFILIYSAWKTLIHRRDKYQGTP